VTSAGSIFNDLDALRLAPDAAALDGVREVLSHVPVRKPLRTEYLRVHPDPEMVLATAVFFDKEERDEVFIVTPGMRAVMAGELKSVLLATTVTRQGVTFLWPVPLPGANGRTYAWWETARQAAELAKTTWVRVASDSDLGAYRIFVAEDQLPDPAWPDMPLSRLLEIGFRDRVIAGVDHPLVRRLRGKA